MADAEIVWEGESGREYSYWIHRIGTQFHPEPGNYIYAREVEPDAWVALHIGEARSLEGRLSSKEGIEWAKRNGATHLHVHTTPGGEARRLAEQADLAARWRPVCGLGPKPDHDDRLADSPR